MDSLRTRQNRPAVIGALVLVLAVIILYLPPIYNQVSFAGPLYQIIVILLAWGGSALSFRLALSYRGGEVLRTIWLLLGFGLMLWGGGEILWGMYYFILEIDPYPSLADWLWI